MKTSDLLIQLRDLGVKLWVEGNELKCKAPKGALTAELRADLGAKKQELIGLLAPSVADSVDVIPKAPEGEPLVLSFTQQRLWFLDQMEPGVITYNMWAALKLIGALDLPALQRTLDEVVRRHRVLRATFHAVNGVPQQIISDDFHVDVEMLGGDATKLDDEDLASILLARLEKPFDLEKGPMVRATIVRRNANEHVLILVVHHIVFDGLSISLFFREVGAIYPAFAGGKPSPLAEVDVQYTDYAAWQRQLLEGDELERRMGYWRNVLEGSLAVLELPTDHARPAIQTFEGNSESDWFADELAEGIEGLATRTGSTPFLVLLATYQVLLARLTGQTDILIGTAMANRGRPELQGLLGYFVNTLVLRTDLSGDLTFRELIERASSTFFGAVDNQDMPFERLVDEIQPERNLSYSPLFQTLFVLDQDTGDERAMGDIAIRPFVLENRVARTDLVVHAYRGRDQFDVEGRLKVGMEYNTDLFEPATIERLLECYECLLASVMANPDEKISRLVLLPEEQRRVVLEQWNATEADYSQEPTHIQFEAQADRTPDATALIYPRSANDGGDIELSFSELDGRANRMANYLTSRGVQAGTMVGLSLDRSADMIVALLGILKTGAAYVPLDPSYPADRVAYMAEDAGLEYIVTTSDLRHMLPDAVTAIELDMAADEVAAADAARPSASGVEVSLSDRMYVIYTSGSTGRPKGVELEHRSVSNFLASMAREPGFHAGDRLLAVTTLSFDISVLEVMLPLLYGGTLIVAPREAVGDGEALLKLIERLKPQVMQATPATWRMMLLSGWDGSPDMRAFSGGEALPRDLADEILPNAAELWNLYGPTETTIWSAVKKIEADGEPITIGHPIACTQIYILDANLELLPLGVPGELFIAGDGLARGYLERPELTEERFLKDPFSRREGARMYRTGDKARWLTNGDVECLGRIDNQVKLRGFRIELGEIESVVADVDGVHQCVCVIREDTPGDQRLTAYVVPESGAAGIESLDTGKLRDAAADKLPAYMVPAAFVPLEALPHTPNGKVDRNALLALEGVQSTVAAADIVAPRNETERKIAAVWSEVLGTDAVSVNVNFFDLGGHSLLLAQVRSKLHDALGVELTIIELFQFPTVSQLATRVGGKDGGDVSKPKDRSRSLSAGRKALMRRRRR